jgi:hypothetical protein
MILKPALTAMLASGLIVPEAPKLVLPKPAIVKRENLELTRHILLGMPLTMGMLPGKVVPAIAITDDFTGGPSSGAGTSAHTYSSKTSTQSSVLVLLSYQDSGSDTVSSVTWNGVSGTILVQNVSTVDTNRQGVAIVGWTGGTLSGNIVVNFSASVTNSYVTIASLSNLVSLTPITTGSVAYASGVSTAASLTLTTPGIGGIRVYLWNRFNNTAGALTTWTGATELSDVDVGSWTHSTAYSLGNNSGSVNPNNNTTNGRALAGVSLR